MYRFIKFIFGIKLYMFRTVPVSIIRGFSLHTQQWYMSYRLCWHIPLLCVQWKTPDDGHRNCPKHVEFYSKNKFDKSVHLVGFIIRIQNFCTLVHFCTLIFYLNNIRIQTLQIYLFLVRMSIAKGGKSCKLPLMGVIICRYYPILILRRSWRRCGHCM